MQCAARWEVFVCFPPVLRDSNTPEWQSMFEIVFGKDTGHHSGLGHATTRVVSMSHENHERRVWLAV